MSVTCSVDGRRANDANHVKFTLKNVAAVAGPPLLVIGVAMPFMSFTPSAKAQIADAAPAPAPALAPVVKAPPPPRRRATASYSLEEVRCLASAMYHEARSQPVEGQIAIAEVVIARSKDDRWKGNLCHTITMRRQFSFVRGGRAPRIPDADAASQMERLARDVLAGRVSSRAKGSLYFHASYVAPAWRHSLTQRARIQSHIFYADATS